MRKKMLLIPLAILIIVSLVACAAPAPTPAPAPGTVTAPAPAPATVTGPATTATVTAPAPAQPAEVFKWRMQCIHAFGSTAYSLDERICDSIRKMSDGRLDITPYPGGALVPSIEIVDSLAQGVIEMSHTAGAYYTGIAPELALEPQSLPPFITRGFVDMMELVHYWGLYEIVESAYAELDVQLLAISLGTKANWWSKYPLEGVEDLKGFKIRLWGGYVGETFKKLGAAVVFLPHEEVYTALATGVIDGSGTGLGIYLDLALYEHCPYIYAPPLLNPSSDCYLASKDAWNALPDDLQEILHIASYVHGTMDTVESQELEARTIYSTEAQAKLGLTIIQWPEADLKVLSEAALSLLPEFAAKSPQCAEGVRIIENFMKAKGYVD